MSPYRRSAKNSDTPETDRALPALVVVVLAVAMTMWWLRPAQGPSVRSGAMGLPAAGQNAPPRAHR